MNNQTKHIVTVEDALEAFLSARITKVHHLPRQVYKQLCKLGLVMTMESSSGSLLLTGKGLARLREARQVDLEQGRKNQISRNG